MLELALTEKASITLEYNQQLTVKPQLILGDLSVILTTANTPAEMENEREAVIGSKEKWLHMTSVDTLGFDAESKLLKLVSLFYPEQNLVPSSLTNIEKVEGLPKLSKYSEDFQLEPFQYRYYHLEGNILLCFNDEFAQASKLIEVSVSKDFSLFFSDNLYCGWGLYHPENFIDTDPEFLRDAFDLITDENFDKIINEDKDVLQQIAALHNRINASSALAQWLFDLADRYYNKEEMNRLFKKPSGLST